MRQLERACANTPAFLWGGACRRGGWLRALRDQTKEVSFTGAGVPCGHRGLFFVCYFGRLRGGVSWRHAVRRGKGLSFGMGFFRPCGHGGLFFVCYFGRLRGARQGGAGYGAAPPSRPPLHPPRSTPLGLSSSRQPARAARLLLRELPSLRSGDLPARRATPSFAFALPKNSGASPYLKMRHSVSILP